MYNGIGLTTPRGSGTNGHVQRNWAFVRTGKQNNSYRAEEDTKRLDAQLNRLPNKEILDHDRKRKVEVKCLELEETLEKQNYSSAEIQEKVNAYRQKLLGQTERDNQPKDESGRITVRETHQIAAAQQEKNAKLREAFNISECFVEGSSFGSFKNTKEEISKNMALQKELDEQIGALKATAPTFELEKSRATTSRSDKDYDNKSEKKKKKKRQRSRSSSTEYKSSKRKKSKKQKKESGATTKNNYRKRNRTFRSKDVSKTRQDEGAVSDNSCEPLKKVHKRSKKNKKHSSKKKRKESVKRRKSSDSTKNNGNRHKSKSKERRRSRSPEREKSCLAKIKRKSISHEEEVSRRKSVAATRTMCLQTQNENDSDENYNLEKLERSINHDVLDEFQSVKRTELMDLHALQQLKSGIAAKAKEKEKIKSIEKLSTAKKVFEDITTCDKIEKLNSSEICVASATPKAVTPLLSFQYDNDNIEEQVFQQKARSLRKFSTDFKAKKLEEKSKNFIFNNFKTQTDMERFWDDNSDNEVETITNKSTNKAKNNQIEAQLQLQRNHNFNILQRKCTLGTAESMDLLNNHHNNNNNNYATKHNELQTQPRLPQLQLQHANKSRIIIKPFKIHETNPLVASLTDSKLVDEIVSKVSTATVAAAEKAARRSRSRVPHSSSNDNGHFTRSYTHSSPSSRSSSSSRSHSSSHSRGSICSLNNSSPSSRSHSCSSRNSYTTSSYHSASRSPSIPRRRGSPSFLDRRRITSARKRPISYHRKTPSDESSYCTSCCESHESSPHSRSCSPTYKLRESSISF